MTINCSQALANGTYNELLCSDSSYCCSGTINTCSTTKCSESSSSSDSSSQLPVLFWGILGGLFATGIILICLTYIICRFRSPDSCMSKDPIEEILEESESHEVRTVTSESRSTNPNHYIPTFLIRRESLWKLRTRHKSQRTLRVAGIHPHLVCVQCADKKMSSKEDADDVNSRHSNNIHVRVQEDSSSKDLPNVSS